MTRLAAAEVDGERLSEDEILAFFQLLLVAGPKAMCGAGSGRARRRSDPA